MASLTVENYVKTIFQLAESAEAAVATGQIATALGVLPGTVTSMLKTLDESNLATYMPYEGVRLTSAGRLSEIGSRYAAAPSVSRELSAGTQAAIKYVGMLGMPVLVLAVGLLLYMLRKARRRRLVA